jgi:hypothetical protein
LDEKDSHWRAEVMSATEAEEDALCSLAAFIADNTVPGTRRYSYGSKMPRKNWFHFVMPWIA